MRERDTSPVRYIELPLNDIIVYRKHGSPLNGITKYLLVNTIIYRQHVSPKNTT